MLNTEKIKNPGKIFKKMGVFIIVLFFVAVGIFYFPLFYREFTYFFNSKDYGKKSVIYENEAKSIADRKNIVIPADKDFGIIIPKLDINSSIVPNVDPNNPNEYQIALSKGVAHAQGTVFPGQPGNVFLFAHSAVDLINAKKYNGIFYLLYKLDKDDEIYISYNSKIYRYIVYDKKLVNPNDVEFLYNASDSNTLTLMTCWPVGSQLKRQIILARLQNV